MSHDIPIRIVVLGAARVGKSSIISRFLSKTFENKYRATVDEFLEGELWMGGLRFKLAIIDTAGSYSFPAMNRVSIATADAVLLVYSIDDPASFRQVVELRQQVGEQRRDVPVVVVGNKSDLKCQCPTVGGPESATSWAYVDLDRGHVEVSAKEDVNIGEIFVELVSQGNISAKLEQQIRSGLSTTTSRDCSNVNKCCTIS